MPATSRWQGRWTSRRSDRNSEGRNELGVYRLNCELTMDKYPNFAALKAAEKRDVDYRVREVRQCSNVAIIAPHGGGIEPGTSEIAEEVASTQFSYYSFEGLDGSRPHRDLHITSTSFDEPTGCALVTESDLVVAIHGRSDSGDPHTISVGGLDDLLANEICKSLKKSGFIMERGHGHLAGKSPENICNRSRIEAGVQIELPRTLRESFLDDKERLASFCDAIRVAILADKRAKTP